MKTHCQMGDGHRLWIFYMLHYLGKRNVEDKTDEIKTKATCSHVILFSNCCITDNGCTFTQIFYILHLLVDTFVSYTSAFQVRVITRKTYHEKYL
jgi:hypothetical protein